MTEFTRKDVRRRLSIKTLDLLVASRRCYRLSYLDHQHSLISFLLFILRILHGHWRTEAKIRTSDLLAYSLRIESTQAGIQTSDLLACQSIALISELIVPDSYTDTVPEFKPRISLFVNRNRYQLNYLNLPSHLTIQLSDLTIRDWSPGRLPTVHRLRGRPIDQDRSSLFLSGIKQNDQRSGCESNLGPIACQAIALISELIVPDSIRTQSTQAGIQTSDLLACQSIALISELIVPDSIRTQSTQAGIQTSDLLACQSIALISELIFPDSYTDTVPEFKPRISLFVNRNRYQLNYLNLPSHLTIQLSDLTIRDWSPGRLPTAHRLRGRPIDQDRSSLFLSGIKQND
ncbi:hypothetical protein EGW08_011608 [Elysia chlorotica]|uniref:Uncharacterized protein n=1 Tax=Elysia chlorotica TaxID=188477 RepID=A0A3S1BH53_ELYCH|nr:hypothetical protein EGW08_011608 [Elysia chlorotica]